MRLTTKARYAVMAMVDLAATGDGVPTTLAEVADRQQISLSYLEQLFARLRRAGLVNSVRGPGGGYLLAQDAEDLCICDIVQAVDEPMRATRCQGDANDGCMNQGQRCMTHDLWEELGNQINLFLSSVSLADVANGRLPRAGEGACRIERDDVDLMSGHGNGSEYGPALAATAED